MNASNTIDDDNHRYSNDDNDDNDDNNNNLPPSEDNDNENDNDNDNEDNELTSMETVAVLLDTTNFGGDGGGGKAQDILQARETVKLLEKKHAERTEKACLMVDAKRTWKNLSSSKRNNPQTIHFILDVCNPKTNPLPYALTWEGASRCLSWRILSNRDLLLKRLELVPHFETTYYGTVFEPPQTLKNDKQVMLAICSRNSQALQYCSKKLQNDPQVVRAAVTHRFHYAPTAIQWASAKLRNERTMAKYVLGQRYGIRAFWLLGKRLQRDAQLAILAIKKAGKSYAASNEHLLDLPFEFRYDKKVVWEAVKQRGSNLRFITDPNLVSNYDLVLEACRQDGTALVYAHSSVQRKILSDPNDLMMVLSNGGGTWIEAAPMDAYWEPPYMITAMANGYNGEGFRLDVLYKTDPDFFYELLSASNNIHEVYKALPIELQENKNVIQAIIDTNEHVNEALVRSFFKQYDFFAEDQTFLFEVISKGFVTFLGLSSAKSVMKDKKFVIQAAKVDGFVLEYASENLKLDEDCLRVALAESQYPIDFDAIDKTFPSEIWNRSTLVTLIIVHANKNDFMDDDDMTRTILEKVPLSVWRDRTIFLEYTKRGFPQENINIEARRMHSDDAEIQLAYLAHKPSLNPYRWWMWFQLGGPSSTLTSSLRFQQQAVLVAPEILAQAPKSLMHNFELMLTAIGNSVSPIFLKTPNLSYLIRFDSLLFPPSPSPSQSRLRASSTLHRMYRSNYWYFSRSAYEREKNQSIRLSWTFLVGSWQIV